MGRLELSQVPGIEVRMAAEHELKSLPQVSDKLPLSVYIALAGGATERFAYFALTTPWRQLPHGSSQP